MEAHRSTAPQLLSELAHVLSQHNWSAEGRVAHGLVKILHYTQQELSALARPLPGPQHTEQQGKPLGSSMRDCPLLLSSAQREAPSCQVKLQLSSSAQVQKKKSFSCTEWIAQQQEASGAEDVPLFMSALEDLHQDRSSEAGPPHLNMTFLLRHYGDLPPKTKSKSEGTEARPGSFVNVFPQIPDQSSPKLHYRIPDGSSFIYYPSGRVAMCQSASAQPYGGFYTNVFSDSEPPVIKATITASGHGAATHPRSSSISAVWDQKGGLLFDLKGNVTNEWNWSSGQNKRSTVIQVTEAVSLDLCNGSSALLKFDSNTEQVYLPLTAISNRNASNRTPYLQTDTQFTSETARNLLRVPGNAPQIDKVVGRLQGGPSLWRREGRPIRELRKIQQRVQCTLNKWMDFYCRAIEIKCPHMQRMPDAPLRSRLKREVQLAAVPPLSSPERTDAESVPRLRDVGLHRHLSLPEQKKKDASLKLSRIEHMQTFVVIEKKSSKRRTKADYAVRIGPFLIHGDMKPESVIVPVDPDERITCFTHPLELPFSPSAPLTHCPVLLRAALSGGSSQRRCRCSPLTMPVVSDLEYDLFVKGQPPHIHQMLIVLVTCQNLYPPDASRDASEQLYRRMNKHRMTPCAQCQVDSFRLVSYEVSTPKPCFEAAKALLQQRHNAAPGMVLMYIKGKLLFMGYIESSGHTCVIEDIEKQISKARRDYRSDLFLPPDYKFRDNIHPVGGKVTTSSTSLREEPKKSRSPLVKVKGPQLMMLQSLKDP